MSSVDSDKLATSIRALAGSRDERIAFVTEGVKQAKELQGKSVQEYEMVVSSLLMCLESFEVVHGTSLDVLCELTVLDILLNLDLSVIQLSQCNSYLRLCLMAVNEIPVAVAAAKTFAQTLSYSMTTDFVRTQIGETLEWISLSDAKSQPRRICGILVLTEVALRIPMVILPRLSEVFDRAWDCLVVHDEEVRSRALCLFTLCAKLLVNRPAAIRAETCDALMSHLKGNLASKSKGKRIAGLLAFEPIVINSIGTSNIRYEDLSNLLVPYIMGGGANVNADTRELLFRCLVVLCRFSAPQFVAHQLKESVRFALDSINRNIQRNTAFEMLSEIIPIVGKTEFAPFVDDTCEVIKTIFEKSPSPCWKALQCFSIICKECRPSKMETYVESCIENVFVWGLSAELIECMRAIIESSSVQYRAKLEESLLDMISVTLCGLPFRQQIDAPRVSESSTDVSASEYQISVALNALKQFGFSNSELMGDFLRVSVLPFIDNNSVAVRNAAVYTIVKLLIPPGEKGDLSIARRMCVNTVITRMLVVGLSDPNPVVRQTILSAFTEDFYPYLSEQQYLFRFYSALGDESINCRVAATEQLCQMIRYDPSHILPALREEMVVILHFITSTFNMDTVQNGFRLLAAIATRAPQLVVNFTEGICEALAPYFSTLSSRSGILLSFLHCCTAVAAALRKFGSTPFSSKREIALVCELLETLPADRSYHIIRLSCLRFLSATLAPLMEGASPYVLYPRLFQQLCTVLHRTEESVDIRLEALRCIGVIGALDSHVFQSFNLNEKEKASGMSAVVVDRVTHVKCCRIVLCAVAALLDPESKRSAGAREGLLRTGVQTMLNIFEHVPCSKSEIGLVIGPLARVIRQLPGGRLFATVLFEFCNIIRYGGAVVLNDLNEIYRVFDNVWEFQVNYRFLAVRMLSFVANFEASGNLHYGQQHSRILPQLFDTLNRADLRADLKYAVLEYIVRHVDSLQPCTEAAVDNLLGAIQNPANPLDFVNHCVVTLKEICVKLYVDELVGAIVRCLLACLSVDLARKTRGRDNIALCNNIMGVFCVLIEELQGNFLKYSTYIIQALKNYRITNTEFGVMNNRVATGLRCARSAMSIQQQNAEVAALLKTCESVVMKSMSRMGEVWSYANLNDDNANAGAAEERTMPINEQRLINPMKVVPLTKEEWVKWSDQFAITLLQESPFQVFRCTAVPIGINAAPLVEKSTQFVQDTLQIAFRSMWNYASSALQTAITDFFRQSFRQAMMSTTVPAEVVTMLLGIVEYMDHVGEALFISYNDLSECAWNRGMLAKALFWREAAYRDDPVGTVESLISLYSELHMVDSSVGILNMTSEEQRRSLLQTSLVKLARYTEALQLTQQELELEAAPLEESSTENLSKGCGYKNGSRGWSRMLHYTSNSDLTPSSSKAEESCRDRRVEVNARLMLCLSELGEYDKVLEQWGSMLHNYKDRVTDTDEMHVLFFVSQYAADASIRLQSWDTLEHVLDWLPPDMVLYHVSKAALEVVRGNYDAALVSVTNGRKVLLEDLTSLLHESYARAYEGLVVAQQLTEVEEVIIAKQTQKALSSAAHIPHLCHIWEQRIRMMHATVPTWKQVLGIRGLLISPHEDVKTRIQFTKLCRQEKARQLEKFTLAELLGFANPTLEQLTSRNVNPRVVMQYISYLSETNALGPGSAFGTESDLIKKMIDVHTKAENSAVLARAYTRLGSKVDLIESVQCFKTAIMYDPQWFLAWRKWAEANAQLLQTDKGEETCRNAIEGFIRSIQLGTSDSTLIQDVLKLLTLWSSHCDSDHNLKELRERVFDVPSRVWHLVVPQLVARLDTGSDDSCRLVADVLTNVGYDYPHTLVYPLNLCTMSDSERRNRYSNEVLGKLQERYPVIVLQGRLMIDELIRVSALIYEQWYDKLEAAATAFFGRRSTDEMIRTLLPIHETLTRVPETVVESEFLSKYSKRLTEARDWLRSYSSTRYTGDIQSAWKLYHSVYCNIDKQIKSSDTLQLQFCSPKLFEARNLSIGIPDARPVREESVAKVNRFQKDIIVIASKQRPKRIGIITAEGRLQKFLLKGREDLRLDERVMQLFSLVNILMQSDSRTSKNLGFQIQRYSVTPLKDNVGIIGWVDGCDTLHEVVKHFRERKSIPVELEMRMLDQIITFDNSKAYDYLTIMSKVEVLEFLSDHTSGQDIRKAMWNTSPNCEVWYDRRRMYTTSLANMSIVGYILGLGDRHPNNIMLQRASGLVVHIDFGDCFEVAMTRDKFPEKVPFRLTRMLRSALDVSGVDGAFRACSETAMCVLREGSHSVLALLEAFIQDPLISWRLINRHGQEPESSNDHKTIEQQVNIANMRNATSTAGAESMCDSVGKRDSGTFSVAKHLCGEEVDVVHQGVFIVKRLSSKLKGQDFISAGTEPLDPRTQVGQLIEEATDVTNVAQSWSGWYPFW
ncbi:phosphatidylinositol 3-kinase (tor2)-like protein [Leishmania infantum JPCM5]|uniref:Serine/threonine-protein kinase TOR n=2 Tax=Leishmania infantum TaxID=5671 RepID=A0A6L0XRY2_LEIIN|nr:phosphatidylinositol 3-kinase (tor2)-like protein [Leishmania infantum JPCM5]CAC9541881.1 phosphatidylinositol_3-kinase_(tor2)_-_putative [Leishmania infantum]CAM71863.1 phosphatidylinositol 3-kinase (tor2)-like protein [Leishmania infantum JPCM5]SUZ45820.1 phosphatidylinositol_3-kinase_(tor2)_-_putative [Leishmania infantum]|eukprot:XP_001468774.1 phosphatidylinositol 3-kinase (tor2)-like protein [Leishmania infantum JPCM5]